MPDRSLTPIAPVALARVEVTLGGRTALSLRCLDAAAEGAPLDLAEGLRGTRCDSARASLRWHPDAPPALLPAFSVHERARLHLSLAHGGPPCSGSTVRGNPPGAAARPGRLQERGPQRRSRSRPPRRRPPRRRPWLQVPTARPTSP